MEERYEIRGKLGQGGLGAVYRAWDHALKREVAVKRILSGDEGSQREEATRQMEKETGALAALQHPNIVTIYDVGSDEDGPFVVMELLTGQTLDEIVERAPLTWTDFRELVVQIQEGLIAAQDLGLVHRDLKPSNVMLNWLPSGRFQAKIVDFGLAKFSPKPSVQTVDHSDSVFGSIFYMAPEQFERVALDPRADMYSIGCVYYFTLTGQSPFQGDTGPQVMAAHLEHRVVPLIQLRPDIPKWASDWVMWHINRHPGERPENARETLKTFIQLDVPLTQSMSAGDMPQPETPKRPRLVIPGAAPAPAPAPAPVPEPVATQTAPQPLAPPAGAPPSVHTTGQQPVAVAAPAPAAPPPAAPAPPPPPVAMATPTAPAAAAAPTGPQIRIGPATARTPVTAPAAAATRGGLPKGPGVQPLASAKKTGMGNGAKAAIAAVLGVVVIILAAVLLSSGSKGKNIETYNRIVKLAADPTTKEIPMSAEELNVMLASVVLPGSNQERETVYKALYLAQSTDGTNVDEVIVDAATQPEMNVSIRQALLARVVGQRKNPAVVPKLLAFARSTSDAQAAKSAIEAVGSLGSDENFAELLDVIQFTGASTVRQAAEAAAAKVLEKSEKRADYAEALAGAHDGASNEDTRHALMRLLARAGGEKAETIINKALAEGSDLDKQTAVIALGQWADDSMFETLIGLIEESEDENLRTRAFNGGLAFLMDKNRKRDDETSETYWKDLARAAKTSAEQEKIIGALANNEPTEWAMSVIEYFYDESDSDRVQDRADKALSRLRERYKALHGDEEEENSGDEEEEDKSEDEEEE
jgi:serine/threonine protein kinase